MSNGTKMAAETKSTQTEKDAKKAATTANKDPLGIGSPVTAFRKGRAPVDPNETPAAKFRRLAQKRMTRALAAIRYVANLGNKRQYEYTDEQREKIITTLVAAVSSVRQKFMDDTKQEDSFKL